MGSPAYKACPTFLSSLQATCQLSRSCTTLPSSGGFSLWFSFSIPSCLFPVQFFHSLPLFLLLLLSFTRFPIADEVILISQRQTYDSMLGTECACRKRARSRWRKHHISRGFSSFIL